MPPFSTETLAGLIWIGLLHSVWIGLGAAALVALERVMNLSAVASVI